MENRPLELKDTFLLSLVVELRPDREMAVPPNTGHIVHGAFLELVGRSDPRLAAALHSPAREKPFTLSWLYGPAVSQGRQRRLRKDGQFVFASSI